MPQAGEDGFTLLELLVVLAILALLSAVLVPAVGVRPGTAAAVAARDLVTALRATRATALATGRPATFATSTYDPDTAGRGVSVLAAEGGPAVTFFPDGGATPARFVVQPGGHSVSVDWLTGAVRHAR